MIRIKARFHDDILLCDDDPIPPAVSPLKKQILELIESYQYDIDHAWDDTSFMRPSDAETAKGETRVESLEEFLIHLRDIFSKLP